MRRSVIAIAALVAASALHAPAAGASPFVEIVEGQVVSAHARWSSDAGNRSRIITVSTIRHADGTETTVQQSGGSLDGIGMRVFPAAPILAAGDEVRAQVFGGWIQRASRIQRSSSAFDQVDRPPVPLGFTRTTNKVGAPLYWSSGCVHIAYDSAGTVDIGGNQEFAIMTAVFDRWRADTQSCSYLTFVIDDPVSAEVGLDGTNLIKFRDDSWCRPADGEEPEECHSTSAAALTTLFFVEDEDSSRNGEILDADIEMNAVNFAVSDNGVSNGMGCQSDLGNTFTHEVGHLMGLDHTCWDGRGTQPTDHQGNPIPSCGGALSPETTNATMYNFQDCGETKKTTPEADDIAGVCAIYPLASDPSECERVDLKTCSGCCCRADGSRDPIPPLLVLLAALLSIVGRRRRSTPVD